MTKVTLIRSAEPAEREALGGLRRRASYGWEQDRAKADALGVCAEAIAAGRVRVAVGAAGELVGFSVLEYGPARVCELDDLFVGPAVTR